MKTEQLYEDWKKQKSQIKAKDNFPEKVMRQVYQYEQTKPKPLFNRDKLVVFLCRNSFAKAGLCLMGTIFGLVRVMLIMSSYLINVKGM